MHKNWTKFPALFSLYIAQSIPMSFFSTVVPVIMRQESYSLESIGLLQLVKLPWILKFLWAPYVDNNVKSSGDLKRWIIFSELFYAVVIIGIGLLNLQTNFVLIVILMIIAFTASATQDIATDAFAILILRPGERGFGNSMQSAGSFVGTLVGTGLLLIAYYYFGWTILLLLLAVFVAFAIVPLKFVRKEVSIAKEPGTRISLADVGRFFVLPGIFRRILILMVYYSGIIGILAMVKPYLVDLGYSIKEIGFMSGIVGTLVAACCAMLAGLLLKRFGRKITMKLFIIINMTPALYFWLISAGVPSTTTLYFGLALLWGSYGLSTVAIYTTSMDMVRKGREGTDFTLQIVITHLTSLIIAVVSGRLGDRLGYHGLFKLEFIVALVAIVIVWISLPKKMNNEISLHQHTQVGDEQG